MVWTDFQPGQRLSLFASSSTQFSGLQRTNILQWGQMHLRLLGFLGWVVPDPVNVGSLFPTVGVLSLSWWVGHLPAPPVTSAFILSIMVSMLALFVAVITAICLSCCSCSIANNIAYDSPSSSAAAVSCARNAASLKCNCLAIVAEYCLRSSHFLVKYAWSLAHVCSAAGLFCHATI
jgi:hypothetical protein